MNSLKNKVYNNCLTIIVLEFESSKGCIDFKMYFSVFDFLKILFWVVEMLGFFLYYNLSKLR